MKQRQCRTINSDHIVVQSGCHLPQAPRICHLCDTLFCCDVGRPGLVKATLGANILARPPRALKVALLSRPATMTAAIEITCIGPKVLLS